MGIYFNYSAARIEPEMLFSKRIFESNEKGFQVCFRNKRILKGENGFYFFVSRKPVVIEKIPLSVLGYMNHKFDIKGLIVRDNVISVQEIKKRANRMYKMMLSGTTTLLVFMLFFFFFRITREGIIYK